MPNTETPATDPAGLLAKYVDSALVGVYRGAARAALQGDHRQLRVLLPGELMPTPETFALVHSIAGTSETERVDERPNFRKTAQTESAWCRAMLKRWAAREHMVEHAR